DYEREKWGWLARWVLRAGERWGVRWAHACIAVSKTIEELILKQHKRAFRIPNGVHRPSSDKGCVEQHGLEPGKYIVQVSRIVPEKRQLDLIRAFSRVKPAGWKLAIVGGAGGSQAYDERVRAEGKDV